MGSAAGSARRALEADTPEKETSLMDHAGDTRIQSTSLAAAVHSGRSADEARQRATQDAAVEARQRLFMFHFRANNPDSWLYKGATLMRASLAVQRQLQLDALTARTARQAAGHLSQPYRARLHMPAVLLAALAVEDALKGAIVARSPLLPSDGSLRGHVPGIATGHDLVQLARHAKVKPANDIEADALDSGRRYIEELGRYPVALNVERSASSDTVTSPRDLCPAYRALFLRAVNAAARAVWERTEDQRSVSRAAYAAEEVAVYRMFIEGVYAPSEGEEGLDLF
jgi:hypothetical protein